MYKFKILLLCSLLGWSCKSQDKKSPSHCVDFSFSVLCDNHENVFYDTTWFLSYTDVQVRDSARPIMEQWIYQIDEDCAITLTFYVDSTYIYSSPCEWEDEVFGGAYFYCHDTLYCIEIGINDHSLDANKQPTIQTITKYVKTNNRLQHVWGKKHIVADEMQIFTAPEELIFEKIK